jgi:hypothetical protein
MADVRSPWQSFDLDSGAGSDLVVGMNLRLTASGGSIEAIGQKTMASSIPVVIASDQSALSIDTELPAAAALADNTANPTVPGVGAFLMAYDGATWDRVPGTSANGLSVNISNASVAVDSELPAAAALADATANPTVPGVGSFSLGFNGTTWDRIRVANTGRLQVDVVTGGSTSTPSSPTNSYVTSASLAAGSSANLTTPDLGASALARVEVWASVAYKVAIHTVANGTASTDPVVIGGGQPFQPFSWTTPHHDYVKVTSSAGVDGFRAVVTNLDDSLAADVYATFHTEA